MMNWIGALLVFCGGIGTSIQSGANGSLNKALAHPLTAAAISTALTMLVYVAILPFAGLHVPDTATLWRIPWWVWIGVMLGAADTINAVLFAERLGSGVYIALVTTASIIASVVLDHYGLIGFEQHTASLPRIIGCGLMLFGLALVSKF